MNSPYLLINNCDSTLDYDVIEEKIFSVKIIVYLDTDFDELLIEYRDNELYITTYSYSCFERKNLYLRLRRRIKSIKHVVKNGILTLDISFKIMPF